MSTFNWIHPDQHAVNIHELLPNFLTKLIVVYGRFDMHPQVNESPEQL